MIEEAYLTGEAMGLSVWCTDQAGPFQTVPQAGQSWCPEGQPARQPHEYVRNGTAKALTLFHPADGRARVKGVTSCPNAVLHGWLKEELTTILASLPKPPTAVSMHGTWERWRGDRAGPPSSEMPPLRMLLVLDNLAGHKTPAFVLWLFAHGIMPLYTPLRAETVRHQHGVALGGQEPGSPAEIIAWLEAVAEHWNSSPTPFEWGGKRAERRRRQRDRRHRLSGSGACTLRPIRRSELVYTHPQRK